MKTNRLIQIVTGILAFALCVPTVHAQKTPKMKMTTKIPAGIATPDKLQTRIGALTSVDGVPDKETVRKIYDNLDFQHGVQAFLSGIQIASMHGLRAG